MSSFMYTHLKLKKLFNTNSSSQSTTTKASPSTSLSSITATTTTTAPRMDKFIIINSGENLENRLFRLNKRTTLTLKPGPKCCALEVTLKTNYPLKKGAKFNRGQYHDLPVIADHQDTISSSFNWHASLNLEIAGTFHFVCSSNDGRPIWRAYIIVDPEMKIPIDSIKCQTVLTKNLGPFSEWRKRLTVSKEANYNMIHFTPVQELGASNSCYSLRNQHKVNPIFKATLNDIKKEIDYMEKKWNVLSTTDIVLNHTSSDSGWIRENPECAYNLVNSPHLKPAFLLDSAFLWLQEDMLAGLLEKTVKLSSLILTEKDVQTVGIMLKTFYVPQLRIYELFLVNVREAVAKFGSLKRGSELELGYGQFERYGAQVLSIPDNIKTAEELRTLLESENFKKMNEIKSLLDYSINNALNAIRYERLNPAGPYHKLEVSPGRPLVAPYFTRATPEHKFKIAEEEALMSQSGQLFMANNGWVMGSTNSEDFVSPNSQVFLKRELIAWGDCIKLRYGTCPNDVPYLWEHMRKYVEAQAKVFHGFRIDNCHSTPLHVAEFMVDVARSVRPDIYVMAELFTDSEATDNIFVNRLGITSLIRESMSAHNCRELGRLMYRFGGTPVGAFYQHGAEPLKPGMAHAIFYDQTHDNESLIVRRSAYDLTASSSIINMANCATGSNRGYDELVPHHISVVSENRLYPLSVDENSGILPLRRLINGLLQRELAQGFKETFVDQVNEDVLAITRHNPVDGRSIVLVARTAFSKESGPCAMSPIPIQGKISKILFEAQAYGDPSKFTRDENFINGLNSFRTKIFSTNCQADECKLAKIVHHDGDRAEIQFNEFQFLPSSVLAIEVSLSERQTEALKVLNQWEIELDSKFDVTLDDANYILFRCPEEDGMDPYALPDFCKFTYCGLYGLMHHLEKVRENQDQAHPLAMNLRQGTWLSDYIVSRLRRRPSLKPLADHVDLALKQVDLLPRGMIPKYFDLIISKFYNAIVDSIYSRMSVFVSKGPRLVKLLALSSVALVGECESAPLPPVESKLNYLPSIAAGLPHFSTGFMRNWGRDTFIALRGLLLITGRFAEAKSIILAYARTLNHGLIPNLLDGGHKSRYNCRDAIWWWLYSIREYTKMAPNGAEILRHKVKRLHKPEPPACGAPQRKRSVAQTNGVSSDTSVQQLCDIIQESIECHFKGTKFVEENAGKQLDEHMTEEGFTVEFGVNRDTGFVFGGNQWNCGTWMDKMGSSEKASNKGKPASPRDGSAVELVGLCKAVLNWLDDLNKNGRLYPYDGVESLYDNTITLKWTWKKWSSLIQANFEKYFYIPVEGLPGEELNPKMIHRRGIYKDTLGASTKWQDYQLRPNFLVAMVVAPELFDRDHAREALQVVKDNLCGPLGMKTLDPSDWNYCGDYDNGNDTTESRIAHGFNYHQGPEWLWLTGYYIRASCKFVGAAERSHHLKLLSNFYAHLVESPWLGLPELTNKDGKHCPDSCPIQAWSLGTALEALQESVRNTL